MSRKRKRLKPCLPVPLAESKQSETSAGPSPTAAGASENAATEQPPFFAWTQDRYFELYLHQRAGYSTSRKDAFLRFDQTVVTVSAGAIAISVTFLEKQSIARQATDALIFSWGACILAVLCVLMSLLASSKAENARIKSLDDCMKTGVANETFAKRWNRLIYCLNLVGTISCVIGLAALIAFGVVNLREVETNVQRTERPTTTNKDPGSQPPRLRGAAKSGTTAVPRKN